MGFFVLPGQMGFPVRVITLQAGGSLDKRTYRIFSEPALITARAGRGRISDYPPIPPPAVAQAAAQATTPRAAGPSERPSETEVPAATEPVGTTPVAPVAPAAPAAPTAAAPVEERGFFRFQIDNQY